MNTPGNHGAAEAERERKRLSGSGGSRFDRDVFTTVASRGVVLVVGVLQSVIVARYLLPEGRGQYATLMLLPQLVVIVAPLGLQWALTYYLRASEYSRAAVLQTGMTLAVLLGGVGLALTWIVSVATRESWLTGISVVALTGAALIVPVRVLQACWQGAFRGTERIFHANVMNAARPTLLLLGALVVLVWLGLGIPELVLALLAAEAFVAVFSGFVVFRGVRIGFRFDARLVSKLLSYGIRIYAFSLLLFLNHRVDLAIIRVLADYKEVGYYVTAVGVAEVLWAVPTSLSFVLFPNIVGVDDDRRARLTSTVCRITSFVMLVVCVAIGLLAHPAVRLLYGEAYLPAVLPLIALLPGIFAMALQQVLGADLSARGKPGSVTLAAAVGVPINIVLNLWWIPRYGALGAAVASSVSYAVVTAIVVALCCSASGFRPAELLIPRARDLKEMWSRIRRVVGGLRAGAS